MSEQAIQTTKTSGSKSGQISAYNSSSRKVEIKFMNKMADSSSDSDVACQEKYDVFLSFRGVDTRDTFTSHLYAALVRKKIETYIDYKLESGDKIAPKLLEAIEKSKLSVVIFSKNYASSTWCLEELAHILECKDTYGQIVVPIFYGIDPSHVRKQQGSYGDAFAQLEQRFKDSMDKVLKYYAGALQIFGSLFLPCKSKEEWEDMFNKLKKFPSKEIQNAFRLSYDRLEIHEQEVFIDIACFYKGKSTEYVKRMLGIRGFFAGAGITVLIDESLISIDSTRETIEMHDLLQEVGWAIVREQCVEEPGKRKRLFNAKDVYYILKNNTV